MKTPHTPSTTPVILIRRAGGFAWIKIGSKTVKVKEAPYSGYGPLISG